MSGFRYTRPETAAEVLALLKEHGSDARLLSGGTDLIVGIRRGTARPRLVIDLKRVAELQPEISYSGAILTIGASTVLTDIIDDERVRRHFPALVEAAGTVGSIQIRNRATVAGNICNASPAADTAPALLVYRAKVNVMGLTTKRQVPLDDFFVGPGTTILHPEEIVTSIELPLPNRPVGAAFERMTRRRGVDLATISVCCLVDSAGPTLFAFGAAGPRPLLVADMSGRLASGEAGEQEREEILSGLVSDTSPITDVRAGAEYRRAMLLVLSRRALQSAIDRAGEWDHP